MTAAHTTLDYPALVARTVPRVIHSDEENERFIETLEALDSRWTRLTSAEKELHELLLLLIQDFERRTWRLRASTPREAVRTLMEMNGLRQKDLVGIFESASVVSEVLSGKRELTKDHIRRLSKRFKVSPELFF